MSGRRLIINDDKAHEGVHQLLGRSPAHQAQPDSALGHEDNLKLVFGRTVSVRGRDPVLRRVFSVRSCDQMRTFALVDQQPVTLFQPRKHVLEQNILCQVSNSISSTFVLTKPKVVHLRQIAVRLTKMKQKKLEIGVKKNSINFRPKSFFY